MTKILVKQIKQIIKIKEVDVIDIQVNDNHNFILENGLLSHNSWRDKQELTDELKRERRMTPMQVSDLGFLEKGQCFIAETGRNVKKVQLLLPRSAFWKKEYGNFYKNVWEKHGGEWKVTEEEKDNIYSKCEDINLTSRDTTRVQEKIPDDATDNIPENSELKDGLLIGTPYEEYAEMDKKAAEEPADVKEDDINIVKIKTTKEVVEAEKLLKVQDVLNKYKRKPKNEEE